VIDLTKITPAFLSVWGETIHYIAVSGGSTTSGGGREILAVVDRQPYAGIPETPGVLRPLMFVTVQNAATAVDDDEMGGISLDELDVGSDILMIPRKTGGSEEAFHVSRIVTQDEGMIQMEIR
jgi:hypothetical protein